MITFQHQTLSKDWFISVNNYEAWEHFRSWGAYEPANNGQHINKQEG